MRIVAGRLRGRRIEAPAGSLVRPTSDRARQALFNILEHGSFAARGSPLAGATVLDAFAGTGALGLEALSRGAEHAVFMEKAAAVQKLLRANIAACGEGANATVLGADATAPPRASRTATLAFLDPPYGKGLAAPALAALRAEGWLASEALAVVEVAAREEFAPPDGFAVEDERRYGAARLLFLISR